MKRWTLAVDEMSNTAKFDKTVSYMIPYDLGVTFGTIYANFSKWVKKDLKTAISFKSDYIRTQLTANKEFIWHKGVLAQAKKPCLSLQCAIDHGNESEVFKHPSMKNWDAIHFLEPEEFTYPLISLEDNLDLRNNVEIRFAMKGIKMELSAGVAVNSRFHAENVANFWMTRRSNNYYYEFPMVIDFKIPEEIIDAIREQFNMKEKSHRQLLKWLNRNSHYHIYYAMDGYNGQWYYFFRYVARPLIRPLDISNPVEFEIEGELKGEAYVLSRNFELEVLIPSIFSAKKYGDRLDLQDSVISKTQGVEHLDWNKAHTALWERFIEIEKVFDDKHAYKEIHFRWVDEDLITHDDGSVTSKQYSLYDMIEDDQYLKELIEWATKINSYKMEDIFNFQLYKEDRVNIPLNNPLRTSIDQTGDEEIKVPDDNLEYEYYIKNMSKFYIVDLAPNTKDGLLGILYIDLLIKNQYEEWLNQKFGNRGNDDLGIVLPYGKSKADNEKGQEFL